MAALAVRPLLLDGGMGTRLIARGLDFRSDDSALWNLTHPEAVSGVHRADVAAGCEVLTANTFGASEPWLDRYGRSADMASINLRAVELARDAAGPDRFVLGSISPAAGWSERGYPSQAEALAEAGVNALLLETHTPPEAAAGLRQIRHRFHGPILVGIISSFTRDEMEELTDGGADVLGKNCCHPFEVVAWVQRVGQERTASRRMFPLLSAPFASDPDHGEIPPADFAAIVPSLLRGGVRLVGGCCGSTETHVAAMRSALDEAMADGV
jgi:methionine synthase I (cobalamin-dependent)